MLKIGLTGGIGSGKTTVANLFAARGVPVIDADQIAHSMVEPGQPALGQIVEEFGQAIVAKDGGLNRDELRKIVFASQARKKRLEAILHPLVYETMRTRMANLAEAYCLLAIPLLLETGREDFVDRILVVDCSPELQLARVKKRDHLDEAEIHRILGAQIDRQRRLIAADDVIVNDIAMDRLELQVDKLHNLYETISAES